MFKYTMNKLFRGFKSAEGEEGGAIEWGEIVKNSFVLWHTAEEKDKTNVVKRYYDYNVGQGLSFNWLGPLEEMPVSLLKKEEVRITSLKIDGLNLLPDLVDYAVATKDYSLLKLYIVLIFEWWIQLQKKNYKSYTKQNMGLQGLAALDPDVWECSITQWRSVDYLTLDEIFRVLSIQDVSRKDTWQKLSEEWYSFRYRSLFDNMLPSVSAKIVNVEGLPGRSLQPELRCFELSHVRDVPLSDSYVLEGLTGCLIVLQSALVCKSGYSSWPGLWLVPEFFGEATSGVVEGLYTLCDSTNSVRLYHTPYDGRGLLEGVALLNNTEDLVTFSKCWHRVASDKLVSEDIRKLRTLILKQTTSSKSECLLVGKSKSGSWVIKGKMDIVD